MNLAHPEMDIVFNFDSEKVNTLVIENPSFFREYLRDLDLQIKGYNGQNVLSKDNELLNMSTCAEIIDSFISFDINRKNLIAKLISRMESIAVSEPYYTRTAELVSDTEKYIMELGSDLTPDLSCSKISFGGILRSSGIELPDDYENDLEKLLDYMEFVRELDRDKLFIIVNLRSYYGDEDIEKFMSSVIDHENKVLLVDSFSKDILSNESRVTIDNDLCEF